MSGPAQVLEEPAASPLDASSEFSVNLDVFSGPFDLLLTLIAKHQLDVTVVALSQVTDDFIAHVKALGPEWDLEQATSFLVVAATLVDLKAARLLPSGDVEDEEDLELLEARDLLFARLLQYRAFKQVASLLHGRFGNEARMHPRAVTLEEQFASLLPKVLIDVELDAFAQMAAKALTPPVQEQISLEHVHAPAVSVRDEAEGLLARLRAASPLSFRELCNDAGDVLTKVARFLALLELFRDGVIDFAQEQALGELLVSFTGDGATTVGELDEFDGTAHDTNTSEVSRG